jgi:hypothetical protein
MSEKIWSNDRGGEENFLKLPKGSPCRLRLWLLLVFVDIANL